MNGRLGGRAWLVSVGAVVVYALAGVVPIPGIDQAALGELAGGMAGLFNVPLPVATVVGLDLAWLVAIRAAILTFAEGPEQAARWHRLGFGIFVTVAALTAIADAMGLESLSAAGVPIVEEPGWSFRLLFTLSLVAGSALTWILASWVSREGIGRGVLVLVGARTAFLLAATTLTVLALGGHAIARLPSLFATGLAPLIALAALLGRKLEWPARLHRGLTAVLPVDLVLAPWAAGHLARFVVHSVMRSTPAEWLEIVEAVVATLSALGIAGWLRRRTGSGRLAAPVALATVALVLVAGGLTLQQSPRLLRRGPWAGRQSVEVTLTATNGKARDARRIARRLEELEVDARILDAKDTRIRLRLDDVRDPEELLGQVVARRRLSLQLEAEDQSPVRRAGESIDSLRSVDALDGYWVGPTRQALAPLLSRIRLDPDHEAGVECRREDQVDRCAAYVLERRAILTGADIAHAIVAIDPAEQTPYVAIELTPSGAEVFEAETGAAVNRKLAILVDGDIVSAPVIKQAIGGGRVQITMGAFRTYQETLSDAQALVAALATGELSGEWHIDRLREAR